MSQHDGAAKTLAEFNLLVNMTARQLERYLKTDESRSVGWVQEGDDEAIGHQSGRRIVALKRKRRSELTDEDYAHMRKVIGYVHRHMAQGGPRKYKAQSRWRYSLMNWGHDPLR